MDYKSHQSIKKSTIKKKINSVRFALVRKTMKNALTYTVKNTVISLYHNN